MRVANFFGVLEGMGKVVDEGMVGRGLGLGGEEGFRGWEGIERWGRDWDLRMGIGFEDGHWNWDWELH